MLSRGRHSAAASVLESRKLMYDVSFKAEEMRKSMNQTEGEIMPDEA